MKKPIVVSMGEPAGIATEIILKAFKLRLKYKLYPFFLVDDFKKVEFVNKLFDFGVNLEKISDPSEAKNLFSKSLPIIDIDKKLKFNLGFPDTQNSQYVLNSIKQCTKLVLEDKCCAMLTLPVCKETLIKSGFKFKGQTEYISYLTKNLTKKNNEEIMIMTTQKPSDGGKNLIVGLCSTHESIKDAINKITLKKTLKKIKVFKQSLQKIWKINNPYIAVSGINPHAGEGGLIGDEEKKFILPAIDILRKENVRIVGPISSDSCFYKEKRKEFDGIFCFYHDQALIPIKILDFPNSINVTGGLPVLRVSPDHGPAFDIARKNVADVDSLLSSIKFIKNLVNGPI
tara:strand:- start:453 stop:1481 length:1029 start_codon:yes stop_codon:yes gene_type:complete